MPITKLKVKIKRDPRTHAYSIVATNNGEPLTLPDLRRIVSFLSPTERQFVRDNYGNCTGYTLASMLAYTVPSVRLKSWTNALAQSLRELLSSAAENEIEMLVPSEPGYLSIGNILYRMTAEDFVVGGQRALPVLRKRVLSAAKEEAKALIAKAEQAAKEIDERARVNYSTSAKKISELEVRVRDLRSQTNRLMPSWTQGTGLYFHPREYSSPYLGQWVTFKLLRFVMPIYDLGAHGLLGHQRETTEKPSGTYIWNAMHHKPITLMLWFPYQDPAGEWSPRACRVEGGCLPHLTDTGGCFGSGNAIVNLDSYEHFFSAVNMMTKLCEEMNMSSPLGSPNEWHPHVHEAVPPALASTFDTWRKNGGELYNLLTPEILATANVKLGAAETNAAVFSVAEDERDRGIPPIVDDPTRY